MASKFGLISVGFRIIGIIFLILVILPLTALQSAGWGASSYWPFLFSIDLIYAY